MILRAGAATSLGRGLGPLAAYTGGGGAAYTVLLTVSGGVYTATNAAGSVVSTSSSLLTVMDAIKGVGVKIQFGPGVFNYGAAHTTFNTLNGSEFWGSGMDVTFVQNSQDDAADTEPFSFTRCNNVVIRDMTVAAGGIARSSSDCIDNDGGSNWLVERVKITASRARGIAMDGKDPGALADGCVIRDCVILGGQGTMAGDGIELLATTNALVERNTITGVAANGIQMSKGASASGTKGSGNIIRNNTITLAGRDGINILSCDNNQIRNNTITNSATITASKDGIRVETADGVTADGNIIDGNTCTDDRTPKKQRWGVNIGPTSVPLANNNQITNNDLRGNLTAPYSNTGTGTVISGNILV
jgi:parallel beta-helix repeat protein